MYAWRSRLIIRRTIQSSESVAPVSKRSINEHLLDAAAITLRRHVRESYLENQPYVRNPNSLATPCRGRLVGHQVSVRMQIEIAPGQLEPKVHEETSALESAGRLPEGPGQHSNRGNGAELPAINFSEQRLADWKQHQLRNPCGQPKRQ